VRPGRAPAHLRRGRPPAGGGVGHRDPGGLLAHGAPPPSVGARGVGERAQLVTPRRRHDRSQRGEPSGRGRVSAQAEPARGPAESAASPPPVELVAAFASIYLVWGSTFLAIRYAVETIPPFAMMAGRCLVGGGILLALGLIRERDPEWPTRREWGGAVVIGTLLFVGCHGVLAYAEEKVPSGIAALCLATIPLFVPLLVWALPDGRPPSRRRVGAFVVGFAGVALLVVSQGTGGGLHPADALLLVGCALSWAAGTVATGVVPVPRSPVLGA